MSKYPVIILPFMKPAGMAIFPFILINHKDLKNDEVLIRHEVVHLKQEAELLIVPFYILYIINYLINRFRYTTHLAAYQNICFEREAYGNERDERYLAKRKLWAWMKYW